MNTISDDDLLLLYYGEHDDPGLGARVAADSNLTRRFEALRRELAVLDAHEIPDPGADFGARTWQALAPRLAPPRKTRRAWLDGLLRPRVSIAGLAALALVAILGFVLGQQSAAPVAIDAARLLEVRVSEHLGDAEVLLTQLANGGPIGARESELAAALVVSNRIYRRAAEAAKRRALAELLTDLERPLIQLANAPELGVSVNESLLFQVRVQARQGQFESRTSKTPQEI
jgi:hypothetical protein